MNKTTTAVQRRTMLRLGATDADFRAAGMTPPTTQERLKARNQVKRQSRP